jgi:SAM-dependent methyltransferase
MGASIQAGNSNMPTVNEHYHDLLAPVYTWMVGGADQAFALGLADLQALELPDVRNAAKPSFAIDLGAGFGMHSIPLARMGWQVLAVDSSEVLLEELSVHAGKLSVRPIQADLLNFHQYLSANQHADLILCMGDTLTHLSSLDDIAKLAQRVKAHLPAHGQFVATYRDYSKLPSGAARFIPVRSDSQRILTCFLEEHPHHVQVHDLLYEKHDEKWEMKLSHYSKLRLNTQSLIATFAQAGLQARVEPALSGMLRLVAQQQP